MIKSYDYILGNGKFTNWFDIITGVLFVQQCRSA